MPDVPQFEWNNIWRWADPPPWPIYGVLDEAGQAKMAQLLVAYRLQVAQAQVEFYKQVSQLPTTAKARG